MLILMMPLSRLRWIGELNPRPPLTVESFWMWFGFDLLSCSEKLQMRNLRDLVAMRLRLYLHVACWPCRDGASERWKPTRISGTAKHKLRWRQQLEARKMIVRWNHLELVAQSDVSSMVVRLVLELRETLETWLRLQTILLTQSSAHDDRTEFGSCERSEALNFELIIHSWLEVFD